MKKPVVPLKKKPKPFRPKKGWTISRTNYYRLINRAKQARLSRSKEIFSYPTIPHSILRALKDTGVHFGDLRSEWIEDYKNNAADYRGEFLKLVLEALSQIEGARKANDNIVKDYNMPYTLDLSSLVNLSMKVLAVRSLEMICKNGNISTALTTKMLEHYCEDLFMTKNATPSVQKIEPKTRTINSMDGRMPLSYRNFDSNLPPAGGLNLVPQ